LTVPIFSALANGYGFALAKNPGQKPVPREEQDVMNYPLLKSATSLVLLCFIDFALCGLPSPGAASEFINMQPNWTMAHSHSVGLASDGTYFAEIVVNGTTADRGNMCFAVVPYLTGTYTCPDSTVQMHGNTIERAIR
jgi:hypothetical protein